MDVIKNACTFRSDRIYFKYCIHNTYHCSTKRYKQISLCSGSFPHKIYCWINAHPIFVKIIGAMIFFFELKRSYIPMKNKSSWLSAKGLQRRNSFIGKRFKWSFVFILNMKNVAHLTQKTYKQNLFIKSGLKILFKPI